MDVRKCQLNPDIRNIIVFKKRKLRERGIMLKMNVLNRKRGYESKGPKTKTTTTSKTI